MPFIAQKTNTGEAVRPSDKSDKFDTSTDLECPYCGGNLGYRSEATDDGVVLRRAHFWHTGAVGGANSGDSVGGCEEGGESPEHEDSKMKALEMLNSDYFGTCFVERKIGDRVADCGLEFDRMRGDQRGVVVEVQYKNSDKDYRAVTENYLKHGFAVHWVFVIDGDWSMLFAAKEELERSTSQDYWLGKIDHSERQMGLGVAIWFHNYSYNISSKDDLFRDGAAETRIKIDLPWVSEPGSAYLVIKDADIDVTEAELSLCMSDDLWEFRRIRPSKSIAKAKFD